MTIVRQLLTNGAYGFPRTKTRRVKPVAIACVHITGNSKTAANPDLHAAAQAERNYANRNRNFGAADPDDRDYGPTAHLYLARDGWGIEAIDATKHAAWSNGDVSKPNTDNAGIRRVLALRAKGYNANEAYWEEYECVGHGGTGKPITEAQMATMAGRIAARSKASGLPINRDTVHGHWEINGIDRWNCPDPRHEWFLDKLIAMARGTGDDMPAVKATPQGTIYAYIVRASEKAVTYGPNEGERGELGAGFVGNALGVYGIDGLGGKRAYWVGKTQSYVLESSVTADLNERDVVAPVPEPSPAHVVTLTVDGQTKYSETLP
jgi:hypothetical protein